jgi:hypothetical protein
MSDGRALGARELHRQRRRRRYSRGHTRGLTNADDKRVLNLLRMLCDVVLVGAQTVACAAQTTRRLRLGRAVSVGEMLMLRYERGSEDKGHG